MDPIPTRPALPALVALAALAAGPLAAQDPDVFVPLPEAREIALARSAAPASVSDDATIWVWRDGDYAVAVEGGNGNACMVSRSRPRSLEPICYDPEGARTLLPIERSHVRLRLEGRTPEEVDAEIRRLVDAGELPLPERPSLAWMLSSAQRLVADDGREVGAWRPHLMLYWPYLEASDLGLGAMEMPAFVAREGEPLAHLITVAPDFVDPAGS